MWLASLVNSINTRNYETSFKKRLEKSLFEKSSSTTMAFKKSTKSIQNVLKRVLNKVWEKSRKSLK